MNTTGKGLAFAIILMAGISTAGAFGTVRLLGQNAEHERITRTALGCQKNNSAFVSEGLCFQAKSLDEIAGKNGTFGAVGAPDNPLNGELSNSAAHCDNSKLLECRALMAGQMQRAVAAAKQLLNSDGSIDDSQIPTFISCTFNRVKGRAKCNVIEHLGAVLHAAQDFYAHSNWADDAAAGPITVANALGLNHAVIAPLLNLRVATSTVQPGLISGCFITQGVTDTKGDAKCKVTSHVQLNKDLGKIDPDRFGRPGDPTLTTAGTPRGKIGTNFHKAVGVAVLDTRDKIRFFRERLIATYGSAKGKRMFCAIASDNPVSTCK